MIFQNYALFPHMNVRRNIGYGLEVKGLPKAERDAKVERLMDDDFRRRFIDPAAEIVAAQSDRRHTQAGVAKIADFHAAGSLFVPRAELPAVGQPSNRQNTISLSTSRPRSDGTSKSNAGPTGTIPVGLMRRWLM